MSDLNSLQPTKLEEAIVKTVAYFSLSTYPLTLIELTRHLFGMEADISEVQNCLNQSEWLKSKIIQHQGFIILVGRESDISTRANRYILSDQKIKKVRRALRVISSVPSVRSIILCNNIGILNSTEESDIDLLIIVKDGQLWITRFILLILTELLGVRIHGEDAKDKLCLSFMLSDAEMSLNTMALKNGDIYLNYWLQTLLPVYDRGYFNYFMNTNLTHADQKASREHNYYSRYRVAPINFLRQLFGCILWVLKYFRDALQTYQWNKMSPQKRSLATGLGTEVILTKQMLKFHDNDRRWLYAQSWQSLVDSLCKNQN